MRLLLLRSNPRTDGYTQRFTELFLRGAATTDAEVCDVDLTEKKIGACRGCYHCWIATPGQCVQHDDMEDLLRKFISADVVVCSSPLYYYSLSSRMQTFFERNLPLTKAGLDTTAGGLFRNRIRHPGNWKEKKLIFLVVGALRDVANFGPLEETCRLIADGLSMELGGVLIRPESHLTGFARSNPKIIKRVKAAFVEAGKEAGRTGRIPEQMLRAASAYLSPDAGDFEKHCEIYWNNARKMGIDALKIKALVTKVSKDAQVLLLRMVSLADPIATAQTEVVLQFDFTDTEMHFRVAIDHGSATMEQGKTDDPDLRVSCDADVWSDIAIGELDPRDALKQGLVTLSGDRSLFMRLPRFFPVVS